MLVWLVTKTTKLRLNKTEATLSANTNNTDVQLPPLLFMPLVENAFKYSADSLPVHSFIHINIEQNNNNLHFHIRNNYDPQKRNNSGGIGLKNLKKRLMNYYPGKHSIETTDIENTYDVKISIELWRAEPIAWSLMMNRWPGRW